MPDLAIQSLPGQTVLAWPDSPRLTVIDWPWLTVIDWPWLAGIDWPWLAVIDWAGYDWAGYDWPGMYMTGYVYVPDWYMYEYGQCTGTDGRGTGHVRGTVNVRVLSMTGCCQCVGAVVYTTE